MDVLNYLTDFPYTQVLVLGLAKSGTAAARVLHKNGKKVRVNDLKANDDDPMVRELMDIGIDVITGSHPLDVLDGIQVVVKNPGIPYDNPLIIEAQKQGIPIITEIELAALLIDNSIIGITGSNGKTTTTTLIYEMLKHSGQEATIAGNIGNVATEVAEKMKKDESMVLELSSFQLMGIQKFKPRVAVLLNLFEAHLDFHKTFEQYKEAKANIFANQSEDDFIVFNYDDSNIVEMVSMAKSKFVPFSTVERLNDGSWHDDKYLYFKEEPIIALKEIALVGKHNLENIMAAVCAAKLNNATNEGIYQVLTTFSGVKHRLQFVDNINGRLFYNDSKATNILATSKALAAFEQPTILLAGGLDRGNSFDDIIPYLENVKALVVFGETGKKLEDAAVKAGIETIEHVDNVKNAAIRAYQLSKRDDVILLSPACASWDQYRNFEERGDMFVAAVHTLN